MEFHGVKHRKCLSGDELIFYFDGNIEQFVSFDKEDTSKDIMRKLYILIKNIKEKEVKLIEKSILKDIEEAMKEIKWCIDD